VSFFVLGSDFFAGAVPGAGLFSVLAGWLSPPPFSLPEEVSFLAAVLYDSLR